MNGFPDMGSFLARYFPVFMGTIFMAIFSGASAVSQVTRHQAGGPRTSARDHYVAKHYHRDQHQNGNPGVAEYRVAQLQFDPQALVERCLQQMRE